ncbi:MAG: sensor domain-containing diguanylate cyclase [Spirochaetes bacterium]|nr:sensor domain-containing diguanylate cyclase [Spirochaetota bacterium]
MFHQRRLRKIEEQREKLDEMERKNRQLRTLIEINTYIANSLEKEEVLKRILNQTKILLNCESSSILLVDRGLKQLNFSVLSKDEEGDILKDTSLRMGEGIAGTVWQNGIPILINDAQNDPRFSDRADKKAKTVTRSIIAVPLTVNGEIIGVIEAINKIHGGFTIFDMQVLQFVSTQSAIAINNASLYNNAIRDGMTKLYISKYFRERLQEEWNRSSRKGHTLSVVIFDIDNFKGINDTYGHQAGDRVIKEVANVLLRNCRNIDIPCRYGGEEYTVILPETGRDEATAFAERIRSMVEGVRLEYEDITMRFTLSGGIATIPDLDAKDPSSLIEMADMALYYSKKNGRNRISFYNQNVMGASPRS